jgi:RimJ/RimL family protein N-acetyltransferase
MEVDAAPGVDSVLTEIDPSLGSNRRCHGGVSYACSPFSATCTVGAMDVRPPESPLSDGVVTLRPWGLDDVPAIAAACDEPEIARWMHQVPSPYTERDAREYVLSTQAMWRERRGGVFAVIETKTGEAVASCAVHVIDPELENVEVGYWTAAHARGHGLTTRAVKLIAGWALNDLGAERVQLRADVRNIASLRVAEKAGFLREGVLRAAGFNAREGRRIDYAIFSLLPGEVG